MIFDAFTRKVADLLILHEGLRLKPYKCTAGKTTIGIGRNLDDNGIRVHEAMAMLQNDIEHSLNFCHRNIDSFDEMTKARKAVLVDMHFNLGSRGLMSFAKMRAAIKAKDWDKAADEMQDSLWYKQVKTRAVRLCKMMRTGEWE